MELTNWIIIGVLLTTSVLEEVHAKCDLTQVQNETIIAYVCVNGDLTDSDEIPNEAEWIEFTVSHINYLPPDAFSRFHNLRRLTFLNCDLRQLSPDAFRGLNKLEWLVISSTNIGLARSQLFRSLTNLRKLTLDDAGLLYIEPEVFRSLHKLETLSLRDNELDCLPIDALGSLSRLKTMRVERNPWLCDCRKSIETFMKEHNIKSHLEKSSMNELHGCSMKTCQVSYDCMIALQYMKLPVVQASFKEIAQQFSGRYEWHETDTTSITKLEKFPDTIGWIQIFNIYMPTIPRYKFFDFGNTLRSIEFQNCGITDIEVGAFAGVHRLERLAFIGNRMTIVKHEWFRDLATLRELVLRNNGIESFEPNALEHLRSLVMLDLSGNRLTCLPHDYFRGLVSLQKIEVTDNPLNCRCQQDLSSYLLRRGIGYNSTGRCDIKFHSENSTHQQFFWNSTETGKVRWCLAYPIHPPNPPSIGRPPPVFTTTTTPRTITERTTTQRPGGCYSINHPSGEVHSCACTGATLSDLDRRPDNTAIIVFSDSSFLDIHAYAFQRFGRYLKRLEFHNCGIQNIDPRAFYGLVALETLVIQGNDLINRSIISEWFEETRSLQVLVLRRNGITTIPKGAFDKVRNLVHIDLSENSINCVGTDLFRLLSRLRKLELANNPWSCLCIEELVKYMQHHQIDCNCNPAALIEESRALWDCSNSNDYSTIRPTRPNPTTWMPPPTTSVSTTVYPSTPSPNRPTGSCYRAPGPPQGGSTYHCTGGDVNVLLNIPSYVTRIEIVDSYIPHLHEMAFTRFENLTELELINCTLEDIHPRAFAYLYKLEKLTLRGNRFIILKKGWFYDTKNLIWLDMSNNRLATIEPGSLEELKNLEYLNFEGNNFDCILTSCFMNLPRLKVVEFGRNPNIKWRCWKGLQEFLESRIIHYTNHTCPHDSRAVVRNLLKCDNTPPAALTSGISLGGRLEPTVITNIVIVLIASLWI